MLHNTDTPAGVVATSAPGLIYTACVYVCTYLVHRDIAWWASALAIAFTLTQWVFLLRDRRNKQRGKRGHQ